VTANTSHSDHASEIKTTKRVWTSWILLAIVMIKLYLLFNGH